MGILKLENVGYRYKDAIMNLKKEKCMQLKEKVEVEKQHFYHS